METIITIRPTQQPEPVLANWWPCSQWCIAKNIGGYTLDTRRRKRREDGVLGKGMSSSPADYGLWGSVVNLPSAVRGGTPPANALYFRASEAFYSNALRSPKRWPPKIGGPVRPNTSNMPKAGPDSNIGCKITPKFNTAIKYSN